MIRNTIIVLFVLLHLHLIQSEIIFEKCNSTVSNKNEICFESTKDDAIGEGRHVHITSVNGQLYPECDYGSSREHVCFRFLGDYIYRIDFQSLSEIKPHTTYNNSKLFTIMGKPEGNHFQFVGEGKYCKKLTAMYEIEDMTWNRNTGQLSKFSAKFEQICDGKGKLKGFIHFDQSDNLGNAEQSNSHISDSVCTPFDAKNHACFYQQESSKNTTKIFHTSRPDAKVSSEKGEIVEKWKATLFANEVTVSWSDSVGHQYSVVFSPGAPGNPIGRGFYTTTTTHPYPTPHHHKLVTKGFVGECKYAKGKFEVIDFEGGSIPAKQLSCFTAVFEQQCEDQPLIKGRVHYSENGCKDSR